MKKRIIITLQYIFLTIISLISIFPFVWMIIGMTNDAVSISTGKMTFGNQLAKNMSTLFNDFNMAHILRDSIIITVITVIGILIITSMSAYGFQMYQSKSKERVYGFFLATMMVPFASLMIPLFKIIANLKLINTYFAVIIVAITSVFMIFFFRQSFEFYPVDVLQAARIDGASELEVFLKIFVPSMKSTYFAAAIYSFITSWNSYLWPLVVLQDNSKKTTTLLISTMSSSYTPDYGAIMCAIVISTLPIIIIFFAFQKQFVQGMMGSVKQ